MRSLDILSLLFALISMVRGSYSDEFDNLALEKARIREEGSKATPGQVIHSASTSSTIPAPTSIQFSAPAHEPTETSKPVKKDKRESKDEGSDDDKPSKKNKIVNKKKKYSGSDDEDGALPKRLFRPRFRAESSASVVSTSATLLTFTIALITLVFI